MKKLLFFLLVFISLSVKGQVYQLMPQYGYDVKRMNFDSTLQIPTVCGVPTLKSVVLPTKKAAIAFDSCNNRFYTYNPKTQTWSQVSGGGSTDTTSLSNRINTKIDSIKRSTDSVFAKINGTWYYQFKDSVGTFTTPNLQQVTDVGATTTNTIELTDGSNSMKVFEYLGGNYNLLNYNDGLSQLNFRIYDSSTNSSGIIYNSTNNDYSYNLGVNSTDKYKLNFDYNDYSFNLTDNKIYFNSNNAKQTIVPITSTVSALHDTTYFPDLDVIKDTLSTMRYARSMKIDTTGAFLISVSQPNDSTLTFKKGATSTNYTIRTAVATSATRLVTAVFNNSGSTIPKGSVIYINGRHSSNLPTIALAQANNEQNSYTTYALVENDINDQSSGVVIQAGTITNLNLPTSTYTDGQVLYLSPTVAGGYTTTKPLSPNHIVKLGTITRAHPTFGTIQLKIENGWQLDELSDVAIPAVPNDSNILQFFRVDSLWRSVSITSAIGSRYIRPSDTATMLSHYLRKVDTASLSTRINTKLNISDTATMLSTYQRSISAVKYTDTATFLSPYLRKIDTASLSNRINTKLNITDTTAFDRKQSAAFTFRANNTNAAANMTDQVFREPAVQTYSSGITWTGTTAPSGTTNHSYSWQRIGNMVTLNIILNYGTAGSALTQVLMALPTDCPNPREASGLGAATDILFFGNGQMTTAPTASNSNLNRVALRVNAADNGYELFVSTTSGAYRYVNITVQYFVN